MKITQEKARVFAISLSTEEINEYIREHQTEYEIWLAEETTKKQQLEVVPIRRVTARKGAGI